MSKNHFWFIDLIALTCLLGIFYALWIGSYPLFIPDEGRYCEVAREMVTRKDYITPYLNGAVFLDKPILYYWLQAFAIHLFGLKEWALRLWPAIFGIFGALMTYFAGRVLFSHRRTAILAALILATCPLYYGASHYANLDLEVAVFITSALLFFIMGMQTKNDKSRSIFLMLSFFSAGLATLTKGFIGIILPILIIGTWILILNRWDILKKMQLFRGILIYLATILPWFLLVQKANPLFFEFFVIKEQFFRYLSKQNFNNHAAIWFYIPLILGGLFPWCIFLIQTVWQNIHGVWKNREAQAIPLFLLLWFAIIFIFFSIPQSKLIGYILPVFPPLALLIAQYINERWEKSKNLYAKLIPCLITLSMILLLIIAANSHSLNHKTIKPLAYQLKPLLQPTDEVVSFYKYFHDLPLYLERRITVVADWDSPTIKLKDNWVRELSNSMSFQNTTTWLITNEVFLKRWYSKKRLFVFTDTSRYEILAKKLKPYKIAQYNQTVLLSNQPVLNLPD